MAKNEKTTTVKHTVPKPTPPPCMGLREGEHPSKAGPVYFPVPEKNK